jgi:Flp pilus assembly protein TadG
MYKANIIKNDQGQTVLIFALLLSLLVLFAGLALDAGILYATKAKLSTSVDGACLAGMKNLGSNTPTDQANAAVLATDMFNANYGANPPTPSVTFPKDTNGNQQVKVTATVNVPTYFMRLIAAFRTVPVSDTAIATRGKLIMSIVLDRSGSMLNNGGKQALQGAVPQFIANFDDSTDRVAMISFADNGSVDFAINKPFKSSITSKVGSMSFQGGTFGTGAGTGSLLSTTQGPPLSLGQNQIDSVSFNPGENVVKVIVYFTDGLMNTIQDKFHCGGKTNNTLTLLNYGGYDSGSNFDFFDPSSATNVFDCYGTSSGCHTGSYFIYNSSGGTCKDVNNNNLFTFPSQQSGTQKTFSRTNITTEAQYRAIQTALSARTESPVPTYIYTIGLGNGVTNTTKAFLGQLANDPSYTGTYISSQPSGLFFYIPQCNTGDTSCTNDLKQVFQIIASKVLLRLTQ